MKKIKLLLTIILILCISLLASCVSKITDKQMKNLQAENVTAIYIHYIPLGVEPGSLSEIQVVTDPTAISRIVAEWKQVTIKLSFGEPAPGGSGVSTTFFLTDGTTYKIYIQNHRYNRNYIISNVPCAQEDEVSQIMNSFVNYQSSCETYDCATGEMLGFCDRVSNFTFVKCDAVEDEPLYYISTWFGDLKIYNERVFSVPESFDGNAFYRLTNDYDFLEVVENLTEE